MAYKRPAMLGEDLQREQLTSDLIGIGILLGGRPNSNAMIEETLVRGVSDSMEAYDFRLLGLIVTWLGLHSPYVHADRLIRCVQEHPSCRVKAFWRAFAEWQVHDRRFRPLCKLYDGPRMDVLPTGTDFHIQRHGEDSRFKDTILRIPHNLLRHRPQDVLTPSELSQKHKGYWLRVQFGPTWRADVWGALLLNPELSVAELARTAKAAYATAWEVHRDFHIVY